MRSPRSIASSTQATSDGPVCTRPLGRRSGRARARVLDRRAHRALVGDKRPVILPAEGAPLLRALGLLRDDASLPPRAGPQVLPDQSHGRRARAGAARAARAPPGDPAARRRLRPLVPDAAARVVRAPRLEPPLEVLGVDRDADVIDEAAGAPRSRGSTTWSASRSATRRSRRTTIHGVVSLHACDTATCDALALAIRLRAELIAVAPCCQAELARGWQALAERGAAGAFAPVWGAPHLRRETAADVTDAMRVELLRAAGYDGHRDRVRPRRAHAQEHADPRDLARRAQPGRSAPPTSRCATPPVASTSGSHAGHSHQTAE